MDMKVQPAARTDVLFTQLTVRNLTLTNRIVMSPMTRYFSPGGVPGEDVAAYYRRRAEGGAGLIVTEGVGVDHPSAIDDPAIPHMHGKAALDGWRRVVSEVHTAGGRIFPQLWHQGPLRDPSRALRPDLVGARPSGHWGKPGHTSYGDAYVDAMRAPTAPMTTAEIKAVIAAFASAARNAMEVGFDGIALHAGHGYLIDSFLWADTNLRTDAYGGDAARRAAFGAEIVAAVRAEIGNAPIMFRFSQHKQQDYAARLGQTPEDLGALLKPLAQSGVDLFDASGRHFDRPAFDGSPLSLAGWARRLTGKPTVAIGGIGLGNTLGDTLSGRGETAPHDNLNTVRAAIARGEFDLAGVGRAILNDPQWPQRVKTGQPALPFDRANLRRLA
ncbi:12-oxophytodienoate reductase [Brevundimonas sp.]|uniref:oxidoreductase n=1 Tax=Brevundimonas sp. TaxID=1871086 RepID=UPI002897EF10|nr:12-oxophytodienoate reductase [Brevundimonas sp.]